MRGSLLGVALAAGLFAQTPAQAPPPIRTGPDVGSVIPHFEAQDQNGHAQTLATIAGPKGALLVFFRSADW